MARRRMTRVGEKKKTPKQIAKQKAYDNALRRIRSFEKKTGATVVRPSKKVGEETLKKITAKSLSKKFEKAKKQGVTVIFATRKPKNVMVLPGINMPIEIDTKPAKTFTPPPVEVKDEELPSMIDRYVEEFWNFLSGKDSVGRAMLFNMVTSILDENYGGTATDEAKEFIANFMEKNRGSWDAMTEKMMSYEDMNDSHDSAYFQERLAKSFYSTLGGQLDIGFLSRIRGEGYDNNMTMPEEGEQKRFR